MNISENGLKLLKKWEGCKLFPYDDQTGKDIYNWCKGATIGIGHLIPQDHWRDFMLGIDDEWAMNLLRDDVQQYVNLINQKVKCQLNQNQFDALVIFSFNIGPGHFNSSSVLKMLNDPDFKSDTYDNLEQAWKAWKKSQGQVMKGLINRRNKEWKLYNE
jgi:type VI secretion system secreted protein VgrG